VLLRVQVGAETFRLCRELCDGVLLVDNAAICAAIKDVFNETRSILEPAGAVAVAGAKAWLKENGHQVRTVTYSVVHCPEGLYTSALVTSSNRTPWMQLCDSRCCWPLCGTLCASLVAASLCYNYDSCLQGKTVVAVTSGANINFERLRLVSELADLGASTEVMMATSIPERPGAFREFVHTAAGGMGSDLNVTEFKYRWGSPCNGC
jgi:hypothetical protein